MGLFGIKKKCTRDLDKIIERIDMNMSNNYKDAAQEDFAELEQMFEQLVTEKKLSDKEQEIYSRKVGSYKGRLKGYSHKDQKPYWTKD